MENNRNVMNNSNYMNMMGKGGGLGDDNFVSLREILERYGNNQELLNTILVAKAEQDKLKAEELRHQTELLKYETKRIEYELLNYPQSPPANQPYMIPNLAGSAPNFSQYPMSPSRMVNHPSLNNFNTFPQHSVDPEELFMPADFQNVGSPPNKGIKGPYKHSNPSREEVLTAIRNKVRANSFAKANNMDGRSSQESLHHYHHNRSSSIDSKLDMSNSIQQFININRNFNKENMK